MLHLPGSKARTLSFLTTITADWKEGGRGREGAMGVTGDANHSNYLDKWGRGTTPRMQRENKTETQIHPVAASHHKILNSGKFPVAARTQSPENLIVNLSFKRVEDLPLLDLKNRWHSSLLGPLHPWEGSGWPRVASVEGRKGRAAFSPKFCLQAVNVPIFLSCEYK